ncbi:hypothetical protein GCM10020254_39410 [Streptomyces goshikiensis]
MQGQRERARAAGGVEHGGPVAPGGVDEELPRPDRAGLGEALGERGQRVVGDGEQDEVRALQDLGGRYEGYVGQHLAGAPAGGVGYAGHGDGPVPGLLQGAGQRGADPSGPDDADVEPGGSRLLG